MKQGQIMLLLGWLVAGTAVAQVQTRPAVDSDWSVPAAARSSAAYSAGSLSVPGDSKSSPFRFSDGSQGSVLNKPPPQATDRDAVLGTGRPWIGGRPPLDCAMTPIDARCH